MSTCIFCLRPTTAAEPEEHIIPEGLVGDRLFKASGPIRGIIADRRLVLRDGEVCKKCNSDLSPLDKKLQDELGPLKVFLNPLGTKRGRPARFEAPGIRAEHRKEGPYFALNAESHRVTTQEGHVIPPAAKSGPIQVSPIERDGPFVRFNFTFQMALKKKSFRALHKIAFEMLCLQVGNEPVLDPRFNGIREYILKGRGSRSIVIGSPANVDPQAMLGVTVELLPRSAEWLVRLDLGCPFFVDLSPENTFPGSEGLELLRQGYGLLRDTDGGRVADLSVSGDQKSHDAS